MEREYTQVPPTPTETTREIAGHCQALNVGHVLCKREQCNESSVPKHPINAFCIQYLAQTIIS